MAPHLLQGVFAKSVYNITATVPGGNGMLTCQSPVANGASAVCTLTPAMGFILSALTRDGVDVLAGVTGSIYTIGNVTAAHAVQATFVPALYDISSAVPGGLGTLSCTGPLASGMDSLCTITPLSGYGLASLTVDGNSVLSGVIGNTYKLLNVTAPHLVQATFSQSAFNITATVPAGNGTISCQSPVVYGVSSVCMIAPAVGFTLSALTVDGTSDLASVVGNTYTLQSVVSSHAVVAAFAPSVFNIAVSVPLGNGTVLCTDPVRYGGSAACTISPAAGYVLVILTLDGGNVTTAVVGNTYTIANVTAAHAVQANFALAPYNITGTVSGGNGLVTCSSPVLSGQIAVCQISPAVGFWLHTLTVDGTDVLSQVSGNSLTIPNVTANHTVLGTFVVATYLVTVSVPGGNGTITCTTPISQGGSGTCLIAPAVGYLLSSLTLDGADVLATVAGTNLTVTNVMAPHLIQGTFIQTINRITVNLPGGHGTIACSNPVLYGQASVCQISPAPGYRLGTLTLDGNNIQSQVAGNSFVVASVISPHTLDGAFTLIPLYDLTVNVLGGNGAITCTTPVPEGQNASCAIAPAVGYALAMLTLDGLDSQLLVQGSGFTLYNVTAAHTLAGAFKRSRANSCSSSADCQSGFCADGVCCDRACKGQCEACDTSGNAGTCQATTGAPHPSHPSCGEFLCSENGCLTQCQADADCVTGAVCSAGTCRQGTSALAGGGISGCSATGNSSSSGAGAFTFLALLALVTHRRRAIQLMGTSHRSSSLVPIGIE